MRKQEQRLWDAMRQHAPPLVWMQRIENVVGEGMPDVFVASARHTCWVELKAAQRPKRATTPLLGAGGMRISQVNWHLKAAVHGVRSYVLVRDSTHQLYLLAGDIASDINGMTCSEMRAASFADDWQSVFKELAHG